MEKITIVFSLLRKIVTGFVVTGLLAVLAGVLIIMYPDLLGVLVGLLAVFSGLYLVILGFSLKKYTKLEIDTK